MIGSASAGSVTRHDNPDNRQYGDGVADPGPEMLAPSYQSAERVKPGRVLSYALGSKTTKADPCRESCRFHQNNEVV